MSTVLSDNTYIIIYYIFNIQQLAHTSKTTVFCLVFSIDILHIVVYIKQNTNRKNVKYMKLLSADDLAKPLLHHTVDALSSFCSLVYELVDSMVDDILHSLNTVVHSVYEWFLNLFRRRKEYNTCNNNISMYIT